MIDSNQVDPKLITQDDGEAKKDIDEAPETVEKEKEEAQSTNEVSVPFTSSDGNNKAQMEPEAVGGPEAKEPTSSSEETTKTEEESSPTNGGHESNEDFDVNDTDAQDEEYPWQVSCCGVDMPMGK